MRKFTNIMAGLAAIVLAAVSCEKEKPMSDIGYIDPALVGEWHLTETEAEGTVLDANVDVYLCINDDCTFELYQKSGTQSSRYDLYTGTCTSAGNILSGIYSNGKPWGSRYTFAFTVDGLIMKTYNLLEEQMYVREEVPSDIRENANPVHTKSDACGCIPIL